MFTRRERLLPVLALLMILGSCLFGCSIMSTGPEVVRATLEQSAGTARAMLAAYQPTEMLAELDAGINDPTYIVDTFVGSGVSARMVLTLKGADVRAGLRSAGAGVPRNEIDPEYAAQIIGIVGNTMLSEQERLDALTAATVAYLTGATPAAKPEPDSPQ